ncbi:MAG: tetratricopeptide repeat protein, partial [Bacteroidales bacterium]|nr:tetratricopeptide repeat protein [Bacteroidales bacterium]
WLFDSFLRKSGDGAQIHKSEAEYLSAMAAVRLFNPDAEYRMLMFIASHPESPHINDARLALADYFYQNRNYRKAAGYYALVNRQELETARLPEYLFRYGYSLYVRGDKQKALVMFSEIKDIDTEYTPPALYYYSHIAYEQQMYETAYDGFMKLRNDESFGPIVPFYIVQILYLKKDYDGILEMAPALIKSAPKGREVELYRFIGDAWFNKQNYSEALTYLELYNKNSKTVTREDKYQLGFCYYKTGNIDQAIKVLLETGVRSDLLSQNIWYVLGDCYLKKGDKKRAHFAFGEASKMNYDQGIKEESLFNYAKLTYETSYSPFGEAISAFQEYIDLYPGSARIGEAYNYLISALMQIKNYRAALSALDKIGTRDPRMEEAYQRVAFYRGLELFRNMEMEPAVEFFTRSLKYGTYNTELRARSLYWRGEALYRLGRFEDSKKDYEQFIGIPGSSKLSEYNMVRYNLGYVSYNLKDYPSALTHFRNFETSAAGSGSELLADTRLRIADCYYITTNYPMAISYYDKVIENAIPESDYAMFQKAFCLGLMNNHKGKAEILSSMIIKYPSSSLAANAYYERGRAYLVMEDFRRGEADFNAVIANFRSSPFVPRAIVQLGLLYYNQGENEKAIAQYKKVIENYRSTPEARYALTGLKNAYIDLNDVEAYFAYVKTLEGYGDVSVAEKDSLLYASGENLYIQGRCDRASEIFRNYLKEFPSGSFRLNAQFYLAECLNSSGKADDALILYQEVIKIPNNEFMEQALVAAASILTGREEYSDAFDYYERLESIASTGEYKVVALRGQLRSAYQEGSAQKTIAAAAKIAAARGIPEELVREALFMSAKAHYSLNEFDEALKEFRKVATEVSSAEGAESKYRVAELLYKKSLTDEAEKIINEFINQNTPHQYWMAKMFLLLADISISKGDTLQARATLQSLKEYYTVSDDGILDEVNEKLKLLDREK